MNDILDFYQALDLLKSGAILIDENINSFYVLKKNKITNYRNGCRFVIELSDFEVLFIDHHFKIYEHQEGIDENRDREYYSFKHK